MSETTSETVASASTTKISGEQPSQIDSPVESLLEEISASSDSLMVMAGEAPPSSEILTALTQANIGRSGENGQRTPAEEERVKRATEHCEIYGQILRGENIDQLAKNKIVQTAIESLISASPALKAEYDRLGASQQTEYRVNLLRHPKVKEQIAKLLSERAGPSSVIEDETSRLREEHQAKEEEKTGLEEEIQRLEGEISQIETQLTNLRKGENGEDLDLDQVATVSEAALQNASSQVQQAQKSLERIRRDLSETQTSIDRLFPSTRTTTTDQQKSTTDEITALQNRRTDLETALKAAEEDLKKAQEKEDKARLAKALADTKKQQREELEQKLADKRQELSTKKQSLQQVNSELAEISLELAQAKTEREIKEEQYVSGLESILREALAEAINSDIEEFLKKQDEIEQKQAEQAKTQAERAARQKVARLFQGKNGKIDWKAFASSWEKFIQMGPEQAFERVLGQELADQLRADPDAYQSVLGEFKAKVTRTRVIQPRGGLLGEVRGPKPLDQEEFNSIIAFLGEDYLEEIIAADEKRREMLEKALGQKLLPRKVADILKRSFYLLGPLALLLFLGMSLLGQVRD